MTKESYNFGVDTEAKRLYTETSGMTAKRFEVHKVIGSFHEWSIEDNLNDKVVFGCIMHKYEADRLCKVLNELAEENKELKERNNRQAKQLDNIYHLIEQRDWRALTDIIDDFKKAEEQLQSEWKCYE